MIMPNKFIPIGNSVLGKMTELLMQNVKSVSLKELYSAKGFHFENMDQFIFALDLLYILGKIEVHPHDDERISYVD